MNDAKPRNIFTGKLLVFVLGLAVICAVRYGRSHELPALARESMLLRLKADYSSPLLASHRAEPQTKESLARLATDLERGQRVRIEQVTTRGLLWPKYVRAEISVDGHEPPDRGRVRYFTIDFSGLASAEVTGWKYYLSIW